ncbi:MAG: preprotein translocase subunit YajC [Polyangiaceae bacterium]
MASASFYQAVPPAPGRAGGTPAPAQPAQTGAPDGAPPAAGGEAPGALSMLFPVLLLLPLLFIMFWSTRSQQKKQAAALAELKKGDRVVTQSGLVGKLVDLGDRYAKLELAPGIKVEILRSGLLGKDTGEATAAEKK